jgi:hypothetical protein
MPVEQTAAAGLNWQPPIQPFLQSFHERILLLDPPADFL